MKVLAIGNSFSSDAMRYLHGIAESDGYPMKAVNLYLAGCPLSLHAANIQKDAADYEMECNGEGTGRNVSIRQALQSDVWDVVTVQQASVQSFEEKTYQPYLQEVAKFVSLHAPKAELLLHQTWAYEQGSDRLTKELGFPDHEAMFRAVKAAYGRAARDLGGVRIIPGGEAIRELVRAGAGHIYRDTYHASFGLGRYVLGLVWYEILMGNSALGNAFREFDEPLSESEIEVAQRCAHAAAERYRR